ncbi:MAG: outer-membrane lipoprotein carrier protein LolA [Candidatus Kapabacteria bacterium]|nr:outer-membrane lipoprotein carrier protein LolA [Candidatus Kapabacteria bacterium]MDW8012802.1 outer-membrane lipoprotein carrier protein LolA [Bacteroidota bacterium]
MSLRWTLVAAGSLLAAQSLAADELAALRRYYARLQSFAVEAVSETGLELRLTVARGNRFRAEWAGRLLVCDGTTVWSYTPALRQVVISSARRVLPSGGIEHVLLSLLGESRLRLLSQSGDILSVAWTPPDTLALGFQQAILRFRRQDWVPVAVELPAESGSQRWEIRRFQPDPPVTARYFHFQPPTDAEVIDLRR